MLKLEPEEEIIKKTGPHSVSFLSSPIFWIGALALLLGFVNLEVAISVFVTVILVGAGLFLIGLSYLRRVWAYTFYFTDRRVVSSYSFLRKVYREIYYSKMIDVMVEQGIFGKASGYADVWLYGYQRGWVVGRMRGVRLGDCHIIVNRAWKQEVKSE
jgi:hypothetical protein